MTGKRPSFRKRRKQQAYGSPEELFAKLPVRARSHGYLRTPQTDALRQYVELVEEGDIAMELPTGTGKTTVGLLIAEWRRRRSREKAAYLSLTNQLAKQVLVEAEKPGLNCADLRGTKDTRKTDEVGRYLSGEAIGVTTYSNLFNVNPVVQKGDVLILDDAHGGEQFVIGMWTVWVDAGSQHEVYTELLTILRPSLSDTQFRMLANDGGIPTVEVADTAANLDILVRVVKLLDNVTEPRIRFPWKLLRNHLKSCQFFVSQNYVAIRPIVPPTHTHEHFIESSQRIYMSATISGEADLQRSYGVTEVNIVQAEHPQWGTRYIFAPSLYLDEEVSNELVAKMWNQLEPRRALMLSPSFTVAQKNREVLEANWKPVPKVYQAKDVEDSLEVFTASEDAVLSLAGRYDGIDLPGDDCRLLLMNESPAAVGPLEQHQKQHWKLGPLLRRRERTRLLQGMGRCTRDATDFAVIILNGSSLTDAITNTDVVSSLPGEIQREIKWGLGQVNEVSGDVDALTEMIIGLLKDEDYRREANESLEEDVLPEVVDPPKLYEERAKNEVEFSTALWEEDYTRAYEVARSAADKIGGAELTGYCAWWLYLASLAARLKEDWEGEKDCLKRARATGINAGLLDHLLRARASDENIEKDLDTDDIQVEAIWNWLDKYGWHGPRFSGAIEEMVNGLSNPSDATQFHIGIEKLGDCLGAETLRPKKNGVPDVVWIFTGRAYTFEAKAGKKLGNKLAKKDLLQAKGHPDWLLAWDTTLHDSELFPIVVSATRELDNSAEPHAGELGWISIEEFQLFGDEVSKRLAEIRAEFAGKDYGVVAVLFKGRLIEAGLTLDSLAERFKPLLQ